jgi:soluble lytic murein transglycosylase
MPFAAEFEAMPEPAASTVEAVKRRIVAVLSLVLVAAAVAAPPRAVRAQNNGGNNPAAIAGEDLAVQAREAFRLKDKAQLFTLRQAAAAQGHPLASWVEYWEFGLRLTEAQQAEFEAFAERWRGTYAEDRLRNDWLLELGRRRDWANLRAEFPRFRMNDDREVTCYALLATHLEGGRQDVRAAARAAWLAQREPDDGCQLLAQTMFEQRLFGADELWQGLRSATEANRPRLARERAALIDNNLAAQVDAIFKDPARLLREKRGTRNDASHGLTVLALWRLAAADPDLAFTQLEQHEAVRLTAAELARAWAGLARQAALKQHPRAADFARRAFAAWDKAVPRGRPTLVAAGGAAVGGLSAAGAASGASSGASSGAASVTQASTPTAAEAPGAAEPAFSDETLAWMVRGALRAGAADRTRWALVQRAIEEMSATEQREPTWVYWRARALRGGAAAGAEGEGARALARLTLESIAGPLGFYNQLALEDLGRRVHLPAAPVPLVETERAQVRQHAGLQRALRLMALGLRAEGVREWNFSLRGMNDRELLAAAAMACEREVWDRCINTSERTRDVADVAQRYPLPFREAVVAQAQATGLDAAYVFGLIRQESRFILDARSQVGAAGLMQLMPATARWTARRAGLADWKPEQVNDRDVNLLLGTTYLKMVLDEFGGAQAMGAAAYNAGPSRPRRWREGPVVETAAWVEGIPFNETRDYVKKVLSNAVVYAARLGPAANGTGSGSGPGGAVASSGVVVAAGAPAPAADSAGASAPTAAVLPQVAAAPNAIPPATYNPVSLKSRLGGPIGPRDPAAPAENRDLP